MLCGTAGKVCEAQVFDPDGVISEPWTYRKCCNSDCGLVWLDPAPLETELWKAYTSYHTHTRTRQNKLSKALSSLLNRLVRLLLFPIWLISGLLRDTRQMRLMMLGNNPAGKLLDIGCGGGRYLHRMQRRGWEVEGIDFDEQATQRVTERYGIKTYTGDLLAAGLPEASFDAITMSHTIEHLVDPATTLRECLRLLRPGGKLIVVTPNVDSSAAALFGPFWRGWEPPRHLQLFSTSTLERFLSQAGFGLQDVRTSAAGSAIIYRVSATNRRKHAGTNSLLFQLGLVLWSYYHELRDFKAQQQGLPVAQNLLAIAVKPGH
jgi:2-polyprenyl-3-methyl-5-hydroxy-6-metoxy-1,4-benzoquinol methylase